MDDQMIKFSQFVCNLGDPLPGTVRVPTEEELTALDQAPISVFEGDKIIGGAVLSWDKTNRRLMANGAYQKTANRNMLRLEILALLKGETSGVQVAPFDQEKASGATSEHPDYDPSFPHRIVEIWYDLENWIRYVWNESRLRETRGNTETWLPNYIAMDCVGEHEMPQTLGKDEFERTRQDCIRRKAYCKVKEVRNEKHIYAEDGLLVDMQMAYKAGVLRGTKKIKPHKLESEFEGVYA